jgi:TPR repeat protein
MARLFRRFLIASLPVLLLTGCYASPFCPQRRGYGYPLHCAIGDLFEDVAERQRLAADEAPRTAEQKNLIAQRKLRREKLLANAESGDVDAQWELYFRGYPPSNWPWLCRAAQNRHSLAQYTLGDHYEHGKSPLSRDYVQAHKWYNLADQSGHYAAASRRDQLAEKMTPAKIAEGERLAAEWTPESPCP